MLSGRGSKRVKWLVGVVLVIGALAAVGWWWMGRPLYEPGHVRAEQRLTAPLEPPAQDDAATWLVEDGVMIAHRSVGAGPRVLVVHGGPAIPFTVVPPGFQRLGERFELVLVDQRGCGGSTRPIDRLTGGYAENMETLETSLGLGAQVADLERIRRILGDEQLVLMGHSFGGLIAALYAIEFPERVRGLVLVAPADLLTMPSPSGDLFELVRDKLPVGRHDEYDTFIGEYMNFGALFGETDESLAARQGRFAGFFAAATGAPSPPPSIPGAGGFAPFAMYLGLGQRHDWAEAAAMITAPTLLVHGDEDVVPVEASRSYARAIEGARVEVLEGSGHFPFTDRADEFARVVGEFLDNLSE